MNRSEYLKLCERFNYIPLDEDHGQYQESQEYLKKRVNGAKFMAELKTLLDKYNAEIKLEWDGCRSCPTHDEMNIYVDGQFIWLGSDRINKNTDISE